ncbi:MAG: hypothetical protein ACO2PL_02720, partial [Armatimonadota bacterium]
SEYRERMKEVLREQVEAFSAFKSEDLLNVGFTPETERRTAVASAKGKNLSKWLADSIAPLAEEAEKILTEEQCSVAAQMHSAEIEFGFEDSPFALSALPQTIRQDFRPCGQNPRRTGSNHSG